MKPMLLWTNWLLNFNRSAFNVHLSFPGYIWLDIIAKTLTFPKRCPMAINSRYRAISRARKEACHLNGCKYATLPGILLSLIRGLLIGKIVLSSGSYQDSKSDQYSTSSMGALIWFVWLWEDPPSSLIRGTMVERHHSTEPSLYTQHTQWHVLSKCTVLILKHIHLDSLTI